jgi:hypothetical protein
LLALVVQGTDDMTLKVAMPSDWPIEVISSAAY